MLRIAPKSHLNAVAPTLFIALPNGKLPNRPENDYADGAWLRIPLKNP